MKRAAVVMALALLTAAALPLIFWVEGVPDCAPSRGWATCSHGAAEWLKKPSAS